MSAITGLQSSLSSYYAALNQQLFKSIDQNGDGSVSQAELEQAFANNGGTSQAADQLYAKLDPNATGSVDAQQFTTGLQSLLTSQTQGALIQAQSDATSAQNGASGAPASAIHHGGHHGDHRMQQLFDSADSDGDGEISQSELEQSFSAQGLPTSQADQLFAALDPNGTGSVDEQQFASGMGALMRQPQGSPAAEATPPAASGPTTISVSIEVTETGSGSGSAADQTLSNLLQQVESAVSGSAGADQPAAASGSDGAAASAGSGGSGSGSDASATTQVTYNADGTITTTVTNPDGTQTVTTTGTPNSAGASGTDSSSGAGSGGTASLDQILKTFLSVGGRLSSSTLSSGTLGQLLAQQQTG
jgi:Ca2+-binding EF-hand superfamily protein